MENNQNKKTACCSAGDVKPLGAINSVQVVAVPLYDADGNKNGIDLTDDQQINDLMKKAGEKVYPLPKLNDEPIRSGNRTVTITLESPKKMYKEGRHPNQWLMELIYGKPDEHRS